MSNPSPLRELTLARIRAFIREPEALFWTFGFPIMMALGLGIAFRERGAETAAVGIERGSAAERYAPALRAAEGIELSVLSPDSAATALRKGDVAVLLTGRDTLAARATRPSQPLRPANRRREGGRSRGLLTRGREREHPICDHGTDVSRQSITD